MATYTRMAVPAVVAQDAAVPQPPVQYTDTETYSTNILGPVQFKMRNLRVAGSAGIPMPPSQVAPLQSPYIIASDEKFSISVDLEFNRSPLTALLMCLGTRIKIDFAFEGYGLAATETDLTATIKTKKGEYNYTVTFEGVPAAVGLTPGLYSIAAIADIGPVDHECGTCVFGHGYIERVLLEVYPAGEECGL